MLRSYEVLAPPKKTWQQANLGDESTAGSTKSAGCIVRIRRSGLMTRSNSRGENILDEAREKFQPLWKRKTSHDRLKINFHLFNQKNTLNRQPLNKDKKESLHFVVLCKQNKTFRHDTNRCLMKPHTAALLEERHFQTKEMHSQQQLGMLGETNKQVHAVTKSKIDNTSPNAQF